ncbi:cytochrome c oxidase subunit II [Microvirga sp. KLBC 81]|uniref:cytochrome c oxidase subunit II n=1 Tax=Microvirga sp. KLBC 81 TaxID=1862707 RepID=UPI000D51D7BD|nr:cytochrome c oxidase subunit II [Microvirga sp. KLBC 81]PVE23602.1 cytochrome c oxidase subunit II [Microvirga sp. KLBC 81]
MRRNVPFLLLMALPLGGCQGWQSALDAHGPAASSLARMFWIFVAVLVTVWALTMIALLLSLRRRRPADADPLATDPRTERRMTITVSVAIGLTLLTVISLTGLSYAAQKVLFAYKDGTLTLLVTGRQWWWQITYEHSESNRVFTTANEIHIPVGEPVLIKLESSDVIHSFWIPSLTGKMDAITGRQNQIQIQADRPGIYRGQCAEYCGLQHAHMGLLVIAESKEDFERWREHQTASAIPPQDEERQRGMEIFLSKPCVMCHQIRGTDAGGKVAPDLTHVGSRRTIGAGTLETTRGNIAAWIVDPHGVKPGVNMPTIQLEPDEVQPLASYLEGLK